jgi:hypothetical protein
MKKSNLFHLLFIYASSPNKNPLAITLIINSIKNIILIPNPTQYYAK